MVRPFFYKIEGIEPVRFVEETGMHKTTAFTEIEGKQIVYFIVGPKEGYACSITIPGEVIGVPYKPGDLDEISAVNVEPIDNPKLKSSLVSKVKQLAGLAHTAFCPVSFWNNSCSPCEIFL